MARDMLDPGPELSPALWQFPNWPRHPDGTPEWGTGRVPVGQTWQRDVDGRRHRIDVTPTHPVLGRRMVPSDVPTLPPT